VIEGVAVHAAALQEQDECALLDARVKRRVGRPR
jgi:hypothetical protein